MLFDGGLATWLETGYRKDLTHHLWSTKVLEEQPKVVEDAHYDFLVQGDCDVIITCTYQSSLEQGFSGDYDKFRNSIHRACAVASTARDRAVATRVGAGQKGQRPILLAGSCGAYGAALANGAEYTGEYGLEGKAPEEVMALLSDFHLPRMRILSGKEEGWSSGALVDILAAETVPLAIEGKALSAMFQKLQMPGYVTFSCRSNTELCSGEKLREAVAGLEFSEFLVGVGVNCTAPQHVEGLILEAKAGIDDARQARGDKVESSTAFEVNIVVYPNLGEIYDGETKTWKKDPALGPMSFTDLAQKWRQAGATWIGGCCRTVPKDMKGLRDRVLSIAA